MMRWLLALVLALAACDSTSPQDTSPDTSSAADTTAAQDTEAEEVDTAQPPPPLTRPPWLRDAEGGVMILRGTNVTGTAKWSATHLPPEGEADYARLRDELGMNAVRFLVFWEAIEPERDQFDDAYLAAVRSEIESATAAGMVVLVDMHQDVYGEGFGHVGAPHWTCDQALYDAWEAPEEWFQGYFTPEVMECFKRFWTEEAIRAEFREAWARLARELRDVEGVLIFEMLNEPSWGSLVTSIFEEQILPEVYGALIEAIRAEVPGARVALEPASLANLGLSTRMKLPEGDTTGLVYAPHFYPSSMELGDGYDGDKAALERHLGVAFSDARRLRVPLMYGEWGGRIGVPGVETFMGDTYDILDAMMASAFQWEGGVSSYGLWDEFLEPTVLAEVAARPYPSRVAGEPISWSWDVESGRFELVWDEVEAVGGPTVVTLPSLAFPAGAEIALDDGGEATVVGSRIEIPKTEGAGRRLVVTRR